jgi:transcriptional regulator with XRE-family HTH domain
MHSVGEKLRNERQRQNRSLSAIAGETCISSRYLQAIEEDDLSPLPGVFFYKSFVKQYTGALGMDYRTIEGDVDRMAPAEDVDPLPALSASYQIAKTGGRITWFPRNRAAWSGALLLLTLAGSGGIYRWWQKDQGGRGDVPAMPAQVPVVVPAPLNTTLLKKTLPETTSPEPETAPQVAVRNEPAKLSVDLSAKEKTWVSLTSDGKTVFRGVLDPSQTKNIEGWENAKLLTGNAAGLDVRWNGKPIGPLGQHGQVRVVVFTPENFQILSPSKM